MIDSPTGTVTFLLSDIAESTTLWESHPAQMDAALKTHDRILRAAVEHHNGIIVKHTGDSICAAFGRATRAAHAAWESHLSLVAEPWPPETTLRVRIVLHTGDCFERNGDYFGLPLCVAARLVELTPPGSVWATEITATLLSDTGPDTLQAIPIGTRALRGLSTPIEIFDIIRPHPDLTDSSPTAPHTAHTLQHRPDAVQPAGIRSSFKRQRADVHVAPNRVAEAAETTPPPRGFLPLQSTGPP